MEFDSCLTKVQGCLMSIQKLIGIKLCDLDAENYEEVESALQSFSETLKSFNDPTNFRKINLFLIINSDFESVSLLEGDRNFSHLTKAIPQLSRFLYFRILTQTDLFKSFGEFVVACPEILVVDVLKTVSSNLHFCELKSFCEFLTSILESLFSRMLIFHHSSTSSKIIQTFVKVFHKFVEFKLSYILEYSKMNKLQGQCYFGRFFKSFLMLVTNSIAMYKKGKVEPSDPIYEMKLEYNYEAWVTYSNDRDWLLYCLNLLIQNCKNLSMDVTVVKYLAWCEENSKDNPEKTLQTEVREACYSCREALNSISHLEESIPSLGAFVKILNNFALKPPSEDDEINNADFDVVLANIDKPGKNQLKWVKALLLIENVITRSSVVEKLCSILSVLDFETTMQLVRRVCHHLKNSEPDEMTAIKLKDIALKSIKQLSFQEQLKAIDLYYSEFSNSEILITTGFQTALTETFNKIVSENEKVEELYPEFVCLIIQSVRGVVPKIIEECLKNQSRCDLLILLLSEIKFIAKATNNNNDSCSLCFESVVEKFEEGLKLCPEDRNNFLYMIKKLSWYRIIDGKLFLVKHLIPAIQKTLSSKRWPALDFSLDVFSVFVSGDAGENILENRAEIIAFLCQLLDRTRLQPPAFTRSSSAVCEKTATFIYMLTNSFVTSKKSVPVVDNEVLWLREVGDNCSPLSWFHMRKLWFKGASLPPDPKRLLVWASQDLGVSNWDTLSPEKRACLVTSLCKVLPLLTGHEWKMIGFDLSGKQKAKSNVMTFHVIADCLLVLAQLPVLISNPVCFGTILSNFFGFIKHKTLEGLKYSERTSCIGIFDKMSLVCSEVPNPVLSSRTASIIPIFQDLIMLIVTKKTTSDGTNTDLLCSINKIKEPMLLSSLSKIYLSKAVNGN